MKINMSIEMSTADELKKVADMLGSLAGANTDDALVPDMKAEVEAVPVKKTSSKKAKKTAEKEELKKAGEKTADDEAEEIEDEDGEDEEKGLLDDEDEEDDAPAVSREYVQKRLKEIAADGKTAAIKKLLTGYGVKKFSELPDSNLGEVLEKAEKL
jgi:hypothetical protein